MLGKKFHSLLTLPPNSVYIKVVLAAACNEAQVEPAPVDTESLAMIPPI